jgi:hypothetical protein
MMLVASHVTRRHCGNQFESVDARRSCETRLVRCQVAPKHRGKLYREPLCDRAGEPFVMRQRVV